MTLKEVEAGLERLSDQLKIIAKTIDRLRREIPRRKPTRKAKATHHMTPAKRDRIKHLYYNTGLAQNKIATIVGVHQGRVSEVIRGKRQ